METLVRRVSRLPLTWMTVLAAVALLVLGVLQYRGAEQVSRALQERLGASLQSAAERFAKDFDRELTRVLLYFHPAPPFTGSLPEVDYAERYQRWVETAPFPGLVRGVFLVRGQDSGPVEIVAFDKESEHFAPVACPQELASLCSRLEPLLARFREEAGPPGPEADTMPLDPETPAVVLPLFGPRRAEGRRRGWEAPAGAYDLAILWLDLPTIAREMFPEMARRNFAQAELSGYRIAVFQEGPPMKAIYDSRPPAEGGLPPVSGDAAAALFRQLPLQELHSLELELGVHLWRGPPGGHEEPRSRHRHERSSVPAFRMGAGSAGAAWRVVVTHPEGTLETIASWARLQSRLVGLGTLTLLGFSFGAILLSARRSQQLAQQQLEFVAGVTHELLTPLAALRSAGQNMADGLVLDEERIRRYGALVDGEGRRLSEMVSQVLDFAGMQARRNSRSFEPAAVRHLVEKALEDSGPLLAESGFEVQVDVPEGLPEVRVDRAALDKALRNLIANALKYATAGHWLGIRASAGKGRSGTEVALRVEDRGPGIRSEDLPHLFEPFYRGRGLAASGLPGSGLGLALVRHIAEQHEGRVSVETTEGRGSSFTIHLPAASGDGQRAKDADAI